jgi:hypothetical protein
MGRIGDQPRRPFSALLAGIFCFSDFLFGAANLTAEAGV